MATIADILGVDIDHSKDFFILDGDLLTIKGVGNLKRALLRRLVTYPGSLIHRPEYGVGIKDFMNAPNTLQTRRELAAKIGENFLRDERVESVLSVKIERNDLQPQLTKITVRVKLTGFSDAADLRFIPFGGEDL